MLKASSPAPARRSERRRTGGRQRHPITHQKSASTPCARCAVPDLLDGADPLPGTIAAIAAMDGTVLPIQGPPGTGKTYVIARAILALVRQGHRVGVASNSHE